MSSTSTEHSPADDSAEEVKEPLKLTLDIQERGTCERHVTVQIAREDVDRYFDNALKEVLPTAAVPGFRPGRAPRQLVAQRYKDEVADHVKGALLTDSLEQISKEQKLAPISEPELDVAAIVIPDEGPLTFEFDLEVRPEFDLPNWKGMALEKPAYEFTEADIDRQVERILTNRGRLAPLDGPAQPGDFVNANATFKDGDRVLAEAREVVVRLRPTLSLRDAQIEKFADQMAGVAAGETRTLSTKISQEAATEELRGKTISAAFEVLDVKRLQLPELNAELLTELGDLKSVEELRTDVRKELMRQLEYHQNQRMRAQITSKLMAGSNWTLPPKLLRNQAQRELQRRTLELRRNGFSDGQILQKENELRQNSMSSTASALKEHFILERIAEQETIGDTPEDYEDEVRLIAAQSDESPRRVRAQLEKRGLMDILRNQIIERKVIQRVLEHAQFKEVPFLFEKSDVEAMDFAATGADPDQEIPVAQPDGGASVEAARKEARTGGGITLPPS